MRLNDLNAEGAKERAQRSQRREGRAYVFFRVSSKIFHNYSYFRDSTGFSLPAFITIEAIGSHEIVKNTSKGIRKWYQLI